MSTEGPGRYVPEHIQENHRARVANGETTWDDLGRQAAAGGDNATARWARAEADAATPDAGGSRPKGRQQATKETT